MNRQKGNSVTVLILAFFVLAIGVISWIVWSRQDSKATIEKTSINSYEDCVLAGGHLANSRAVLAPELSFTCEINRTTYNAESQKCAFGRCKDIDTAFQNYCYKQLGAETISEALNSVSYYRSAHVKNDFVRGSIYCDANKDKLMTVYLFKENGTWQHYLTTTDYQACTDIDSKGIPLSISGICYDSTAGWRAPVN